MGPKPLSCRLAGDLACAPARPAFPEQLLLPARPPPAQHLSQPLGVHLTRGCVWAWGRAPGAGGSNGAEGSLVLIRHQLGGGAAGGGRASVSVLPGACAAPWRGVHAVACQLHQL